MQLIPFSVFILFLIIGLVLVFLIRQKMSLARIFSIEKMNVLM